MAGDGREGAPRLHLDPFAVEAAMASLSCRSRRARWWSDHVARIRRAAAENCIGPTEAEALIRQHLRDVKKAHGHRLADKRRMKRAKRKAARAAKAGAVMAP